MELVQELANYAIGGVMLSSLAGSLLYATSAASELVKSIAEGRKEEEIFFIHQVVDAFRAKNDIEPTLGRKSEPSCEAFGEEYNLFHHQLVLTTDGFDCWGELNDKMVRRSLLNKIKSNPKQFS